ncbi:MAG: 50S ribosomal protein L11 methyltransferase, partial [Bacteroidetes bacterium]|nr:50S ribosomal protein L11 methyltransferase [Bacteroidota bacterium]
MTGVYYEVSIATGNRRTMKDILIAEMSEIGFDSFVDSENGFLGYAPEENYSEPQLLKLLQKNGYSEKPDIKRIEPQNWNAVWESQFDPILVNKEICIRAPFHDAMPEYKYELVIEPKMSFGTGHHATTRLMCQALSKINPKGKKVCDMGCGTGILGILAMKMGAFSAFGVDIETWAVENSIENAQKNQVQMKVLEGGKEHLENKRFDIILANINRNVLLDQLGI